MSLSISKVFQTTTHAIAERLPSGRSAVVVGVALGALALLAVVLNAGSVEARVKYGVPGPGEVDADTRSIEVQRANHQRAKEFVTDRLQGIGATVAYIQPPKRVTPNLADVKIGAELNSDVFTWEWTDGVLEDIQADGKKDNGDIVVYGVASQFNGAEARGRYTVEAGKAVETYEKSSTQGSQAQLAFPNSQVEWINMGAANGLNGLVPILDDTTRTAVQHGYLTPCKEQGETLIQQLSENGHLIEYPCIGNKPKEGIKPVYQIMVAAPAFGVYNLPTKKDCVSEEQEREIQFLCALHGFRAQFAQGISLAAQGKQTVILKPVAVGLGAFGNNLEVIARAFYQAASEHQDELKTNGIKVRLQVYNGGGKAMEMANLLGLKRNIS